MTQHHQHESSHADALRAEIHAFAAQIAREEDLPPERIPQLEADIGAVLHRLATDPNVIPYLIEQLPDPNAMDVLKALAPALRKRLRRLYALEALNQALPLPDPDVPTT